MLCPNSVQRCFTVGATSPGIVMLLRTPLAMMLLLFRDGCGGVNFPAPALLSHIDTEDETFDKILVLAGESLDDRFESRHYLKPVADFRDEAAATLPRRTANQLIELCQIECSPRVSFEMAQTKIKQR